MSIVVWVRRYSLHFLIAVICPISAYAEEAIQFNSNFLKKINGQENVDLSLFEYSSYVLPGNYLVDVYVNHQYVEQFDLVFSVPDQVTAEVDQSNQPRVRAQPCLTLAMLNRWGIEIGKVPAWKNIADNVCVDLIQTIPYSAINFDVAKQRLNISVPQAALYKVARDSVSPTLWRDGINAARINYQWIATQHSAKSTSITGMFESGINLGAWRIRQRSNYHQHDQHRRWQTLETNATRDLQPWKSSLILGDVFTQGDIFPGVGLRGAQIIPNHSMLPYRLQGYAPVIRGTAQTNATVTIKQNGYVVYTALVAPGPFVIDDLAPISAQNDFEIIVAEADGRITRTIESYSSLPMQLREGSQRFNLAMGQYRNQKEGAKPWLWQGTMAYGVTTNTTAYGGGQISDNYQNVLVGIARSLGIYGSTSVDMSHVRYGKNSTYHHGQAVRFQYVKLFSSTKTTMQFSSHYHLRSFVTFSESVEPFSKNHHHRLHSRLEYRITQSLDKGQLNAQLQTMRYWQGSQKRQVQVGYYANFKKVNYGIDYTHCLERINSDEQRAVERRLSLSLSISLDNFFYSQHNALLNYYATSYLGQGVTQTVGTSGSFTNTNFPWSYNASVSQSSSSGKSSNVGVQLQSAYANVGLNYSQGAGYYSRSASISGGMVAHQHGVTLSPPLSETVVLISAPGASGIRVAEQSQIKTNADGYAVLPYATPYRKNRITLQTEDLGDEVEIANAVLDIVPTKGAIAFAEYPTRRGYKILLVVKDQQNKPLPLGAEVKDQQGKQMGVVGVGGQIYLTGALAQDKLTVVMLKQQRTMSCKLEYALSPADVERYKKISQSGILKINSECLED